MNKSVHLIKDKIFKKNIIKINLRRKTDRSEMTKLNFLTHLLLLSSKKYETERKLLYRAKELYDVGEEAFVTIHGKITTLSFRFTFLKDLYTEKGNTMNVIDFIKEILFNPNVKNGKFDKKTFELARNEVVDEIKTYDENKNSYSRLKMLEYMDPSSPAAIKVVGSLEELENITPENLYEFYLDIFSTSIVDAFAFGDIKESDLGFVSNVRMKDNMDYIYSSKLREPKTYIERDNINQSRLVMGYNLIDIDIKDAEYALQVYLYILGLGPNSKLFTNVREKESLCYSISVTARYVNSLMVITAGIDAVNFDKTVLLINKQVEAMQKGLFKTKDIESAKLSLKTSYQEILENPYAIINSYEAKEYIGYDSIKKRIKEIDNVKEEDIKRVASKVKLNTIFLLEGHRK